MNINRRTTVHIDLEDGDDVGELYDIIGEYSADASVTGFLEIRQVSEDD